MSEEILEQQSEEELEEKQQAVAESSDEEMISMYKSFLQRNSGKKFHGSHYKLGRSMGFISTVNEAKDLLEKIYKQTPKPKES